jgi:hypothetical protein
MPQIPGVADHAAPSPNGALMARVRKFLVAALGTAAMVVSTGVLEENAEVWVNAALALATALGVYSAKNSPAQPPAV